MSETSRQPDGERARASLTRHDPLWGPQLLIAGAILLDLALPDKRPSGPSGCCPGWRRWP